MKPLVVFTLAASLLLSACATNTIQERVVIQVPVIPESMLHCVSPAVRKNQGRFVNVTPKQISYLLTRNTTSARDCQSKLNSVRNLYYGHKQTAKKPRKSSRR